MKKETKQVKAPPGNRAITDADQAVCREINKRDVQDRRAKALRPWRAGYLLLLLSAILYAPSSYGYGSLISGTTYDASGNPGSTNITIASRSTPLIIGTNLIRSLTTNVISDSNGNFSVNLVIGDYVCTLGSNPQDSFLFTVSNNASIYRMENIITSQLTYTGVSSPIYELQSNKNQPNGYAGLDAFGNIIGYVPQTNAPGFTNVIYIQMMAPPANFFGYPPQSKDFTPGAGVTLYYSVDLLDWNAATLNAAWMFTNDVGMRDPGFFDNRAKDGYFYCPGSYQGLNLATPNRGITMARSTNLINWLPSGVTNGAITGYIPLTNGTQDIIWSPDIMTNLSGNPNLYFSISTDTTDFKRYIGYCYSLDGSLTNLSSIQVLATNELYDGFSGINDPFILRYQGMDYLYVSRQPGTVYGQDIYTNASANFPSQFHLAVSNSTSFGIEASCVVQTPAGGFRLFGSCANFTTNAANPYAWGNYLCSSNDAPTPLGPWPNYRYITQLPRSTFPQGTILTYTGTNAQQINMLIQSAQSTYASLNITSSNTLTGDYHGNNAVVSNQLYAAREAINGGPSSYLLQVYGPYNNGFYAQIKSTNTSGFGAQLSLDTTSQSGGNNWVPYSGGTGDSAGLGNFGLYNSTQNSTVLKVTPAGLLTMGVGYADATGTLLAATNQAALTGNQIFGGTDRFAAVTAQSAVVTNGFTLATNSAFSGPAVANGLSQLWNSNAYTYLRSSRAGATNFADTLIASPP